MRKKPQDSKKSSLTTEKEASRRVLKKTKGKKSSNCIGILDSRKFECIKMQIHAQNSSCA